MNNRRDLLKILLASPFAAALPSLALANPVLPQILKKIPKSGEMISAIGMGSYGSFDRPTTLDNIMNLLDVLQAFFSSNGQLIDSSPMYGNSEIMIGNVLSNFDTKPNQFLASKIWTEGKQQGIDSILETQKRMNVKKMDLIQIHNLLDWGTHLDTLNELKYKNQLGYTGITTSNLEQFSEFESIMNNQELDFIQVNYNIVEREAEKRLLPLAIERGNAVIINMPFDKGRLFKVVKGRRLPGWSSEFDCQSWAQFFLKFIISHPAVTCAIPATSNLNHMIDNMQAMKGRLPSAKMRKKMVEYFGTL